MTSVAAVPHHHVAIVGTGFGGLGAAIRLKQSGIDDVVLLERADDVGGTWRDNTYPGCACDVQSHVYSFSFAPNPDWSHAFSRQPEIWEYLRRCARDYGVLPHIRFGTAVTGARWGEDSARWHVSTSRGALTADVLVLATGPLSEPVTPSLAGLDRFRGPAFHSARWDHSVDLAGKRVAVIGTGASAAQFVPEIQPAVAALHVYQRTAPWVMPRRDRALGTRAKRLFRRVPAAQRALRGAISAARELMVLAFRRPGVARQAERLARRQLAKAVRDPALRAKLTPDYRMGCKRVIVSDDYLPALARPNVEVITSRVAEVREHSVVDADGVERATDVIVYATGFRPLDPPLAPCVRGRGGRSLADVWQGSPRAHVGTTVAGFPNLFVLLGPNTGLGHNSVVLMIEAQIEHLLGALRHLRATGAAALEPRAEAQAAWVAEVDRRTVGTVWVDGGCRSWYLDGTGRSSAIWPDSTGRYRRSARFRPDDYLLLGR
jgi:cation diffusion facilitator CzcD-associated flavoprotein CzcO